LTADKTAGVEATRPYDSPSPSSRATPDLISGECVEGIGDPTERVVPLRTYLRPYGDRHASYGSHDAKVFPNETKEFNRYPLYNGPDIRVVAGATLYSASRHQGETR
jgi:hypothetical protein